MRFGGRTGEEMGRQLARCSGMHLSRIAEMFTEHTGRKFPPLYYTDGHLREEWDRWVREMDMLALQWIDEADKRMR